MGRLYIEKTFFSVYLLRLKLRNFEIPKEDNATRTSAWVRLYLPLPHVGEVIYMYWRGLTALLILLEWAMRRPESWDRQETGTHAFRVWPELII